MNNSLSNELRNYFRFFESLDDSFEARFLTPLWRKKYPNCESNVLEALLLFLDVYAFARQGARPDYSHVAVDVVKELKNQERTLTGESTSQKAWDMFKKELNNGDLNPANNPLCPRGTPYERKKKGISYPTNTNQPSILEFLQRNEKFRLTTIVALARKSIKDDEVKDYHSGLCEINGIGSKIASLFLRDVARFYGVFPVNSRDLLQPVDIWVRRISQCWCGDKTSDPEIAKWIVGQAIRSDVNPEAVNEGMWYFGSQIAGSKHRMSKALDDLAYAKVLLKEHMESICQEAIVWEQKKEAFYG